MINLKLHHKNHEEKEIFVRKRIIKCCQEDFLKALKDYELRYCSDNSICYQRLKDVGNLREIANNEYSDLKHFLFCIKHYLKTIYTGLSIFGVWVLPTGKSRLRSEYLEPIIERYENPLIIENLLYMGTKVLAEAGSVDDMSHVDNAFVVLKESSKERYAVSKAIDLLQQENVKKRSADTYSLMTSIYLTRSEIRNRLASEASLDVEGKSRSAPKFS